MKLRVQIKPNSKHREGLEQQLDDAYVLYTKQPATEGKANAAATQIIAKHFGVPKTSVALIAGAASRYKTFEVKQ